MGSLTTSSNAVAAVAVLAVFALPLVAPLLRRWLGPSRSTVVVAVAWAAWRVAVHVPGTIPFWMAGLGAVLAMVLFALVLAAPPSTPGDRVVGLVVGFLADLVLMGAFVTWEPASQRAVVPVVVGVAVAGALVSLAIASTSGVPAGPPSNEPVGPGAASGVAVGAVLALEVLFLLNPAAVPSSSGWSLPWSLIAVGAGALGVLAVPVAARHTGLGPVPVVMAALALAAVGFGLPQVDGTWMVVLVVVGQVAVGAVLAAAFGPRVRASGPTRAVFGVSLGWLAFVLPTLLYQLHFDAPLPFDNSLVVAAAGALTALALVGSARFVVTPATPIRLPAALAVASLALVALVAGVLAITEPETVAVRGNDLRVVQWNVRQAVDDQGQLDPAAVADAIAAQGPVDVVVLSEVARGWPLSGGLDLTEWLRGHSTCRSPGARPPADSSATPSCSRSPVASSRVVTLPSVGRTQGRSATTVQLTLADGRSLRVIATHLQNNNDPESMDLRLAEVDRLADLWGGEPDAIVAGDLNPKQGDPPDYPPRIPSSTPRSTSWSTPG